MQNFKKIYVILIACVLFTSCKLTPEEQSMERKSSNFELRQLVQKDVTSTRTSAMYFMVVGSYSSSTTSTEYIKVFAKVNGDYRMLSMPLSNVRIRINNKLEKPILTITYNSSLLTDEEICDTDWVAKKYIISCPEIYLPEKLLPMNL